MASLAVTTNEIYAAVGAELGVSRNTVNWDANTIADVDRIVRSGKRKYYNPPPMNSSMSHRWTFLDARSTLLTTVPQESSTITIVAGVVTLAAGTWPAAAICTNSFLHVDSNLYEVASRDSNTQLTLVNTSATAAAGTTYKLVQYRYALPTNFAGFNFPMTRYMGDGINNPKMEAWLEHDMRNAYAYRAQYGDPTRYALTNITVAETGIATWYVIVWPLPERVYELRISYKISPGDGLDADPALATADPVHSEALLEAILSAAEVFAQNRAGVHSEKFQEALIASINRDQQNADQRTINQSAENTGRYYRGYLPRELYDAPLTYPTSP